MTQHGVLISYGFCFPVLLGFAKLSTIGIGIPNNLSFLQKYFICFGLSSLFYVYLHLLPFSAIFAILKSKPLRIMAGIASRIESFILSSGVVCTIFFFFVSFTTIFCFSDPTLYVLFIAMRQFFVAPCMALLIYIRQLDPRDEFSILYDISEFYKAYKQTKGPELPGADSHLDFVLPSFGALTINYLRIILGTGFTLFYLFLRNLGLYISYLTIETHKSCIDCIDLMQQESKALSSESGAKMKESADKVLHSVKNDSPSVIAARYIVSSVCHLQNDDLCVISAILSKLQLKE